MIYFDNAATTPPLENLFENSPQGKDFVFANPSSPHMLGISAERELVLARQELAGIVGCSEEEIIFTSGGTEANNLSILGYAMANARVKPFMICKPWEHPSVVAPMKFAAERGWARENHEENTAAPVFISANQVSHETGDINDIAGIIQTAKTNYLDAKIAVHIDGAQGFCKETFNWRSSLSDMYVISSHKFHGPMGVGALILRKGTRILPFFHGGGQESNRRAGTENLHGILSMVAAAKTAHLNLQNNHNHVAQIKSIVAELATEIPDVFINAMTANTSPYILSMSFLGLRGEVLAYMLSRQGVMVGIGAACHKKPGEALVAMGFARERAESAIRLSFSPQNTIEEALEVKKIIVECVASLRKI